MDTLGFVAVAIIIMVLAVPFMLMLWEMLRMHRLLDYVNFDPVRYLQLLETEGFGGLAQPLAEKLAEKGILLSWATQRSLAVMQDKDAPLEDESYQLLVQSLKTYRDTVGRLAGRVGACGWFFETEGPIPVDARPIFKAIRRDWDEFRRQAAFLEAFLRHHAGYHTVERF